MTILNLKADRFRNFTSFQLEAGSTLNLFYGLNGSGKSSILEAIYFLSLGRSFRTSQINRAIHYGQDSFNLFAAVQQSESSLTVPVGIEKNQRERLRIKLGSSDTTPSLADLARNLPLQLVNPDSYDLLNAGPKERRRFLDWGMFHVEHRFYPVWQRFQRILKQRNSSLQQKVSAAEIKAWDYELVAVANEITLLRREFVKKLIPVFFACLAKLIPLPELSVSYYQGWDEEKELVDCLAANYYADLKLGYTQLGPQKADLIIKVNQTPVQDILSRGEQKLLVLALQLAQGILFKELTGRCCIYLLDDIAAELDVEHRQHVMQTLLDLQAQIFVTTADLNVMKEMSEHCAGKMFHVERGELRETKNTLRERGATS
jgi:DNA replication and repair protein RecF